MRSGEFELIEKIRRRAGSGSEQRLGIGDDCSSILVPSGCELLTSTDLLIEDVHFRLDWTDLFSLGIKSVAVNISDIAAMGAKPRNLHLGLGIPVGFSEEQVERYLDGFFAAMAQYDVYLAGGDTCRSNGPLLISLTVQGFSPLGQPVLRSGAKEGDDLWVSGTLGDSALALKMLQAGETLSGVLAERHFRPLARARLGEQLGARGLVTAMLDISDGLIGDLRQMLNASAVGACVERKALPLSKVFRSALTATPALCDLPLLGGEDYELLFSAKAENRGALEQLAIELEVPLCRIGRIIAGRELLVREDGGEMSPSELKSFDHFDSDRRPSLE